MSKHSMIKKTGEQMLIELGFEKFNEDIEPFVVYSRAITDIKEKQWLILEPSGYTVFEEKLKNNIYASKGKVCDISTDLHKAIHQCLLDFGWVEK